MIPLPSGEVLEGLSHRGSRSPLLLVLPPLPAEGGGMDHVVGAELAFAASAAGHPTLRFNFRGVGASQGERGDHGALLEDVKAALEVAADNAGGGPVLLASLHGSDALALALVGDERVCGACLISPSSDPARWPAGVWAVVGEHDKTLFRGALGAAAGHLVLVAGADRTFVRGLPEVGRAVVGCLTEAATSRKH